MEPIVKSLILKRFRSFVSEQVHFDNPRFFVGQRADHPALSAAFDLATAHARCRSFRRMVKAVGSIADGMGHPIHIWPPEGWVEG